MAVLNIPRASECMYEVYGADSSCDEIWVVPNYAFISLGDMDLLYRVVLGV